MDCKQTQIGLKRITEGTIRKLRVNASQVRQRKELSEATLLLHGHRAAVLYITLHKALAVGSVPVVAHSVRNDTALTQGVGDWPGEKCQRLRRPKYNCYTGYSGDILTQTLV